MLQIWVVLIMSVMPVDIFFLFDRPSGMALENWDVLELVEEAVVKSCNILNPQYTSFLVNNNESMESVDNAMEEPAFFDTKD